MRVAFALFLLISPAALGAPEGAPQRAPPPKTEKPPAPAPEPPNPALFQRGREAALNRQWLEAAVPLFSFYIRSPQDENRAWAELYLAQSLQALSLKHAASAFYADLVQERSAPETIPVAVEALRGLAAGPHDELLIEEATFSNLDVASLPKTLAAFVAYHQGMRQLLSGQEKWAQTFFSRIPAGTPEVAKARYALTVSKIKSERDITPSVMKEFEAFAESPELDRAVRNEIQLALARMHYERKEYEQAISRYRKVELAPLSAGRASLYLEEAWSRYRMGQLHDAMALLVVLDAPSFRDAFLPDKYLLKAFIYRDLCQYLPAKRAAKSLRRHFAETLSAMQEREDLAANRRIVTAATADGKARSAKKFRDLVQAERERLKELAPSFGVELTKNLGQLYDTALAEAERRYQAQLSVALEEKADELLEASEQARLMDYEIGLKLYDRIRRKGLDAPVVQTASVDRNTVSFNFAGEYWNDELRSYKFKLENRCVEEGRP